MTGHREATLSVRGCDVHASYQGEGPLVVFVHGARAHAGWWDGVRARLQGTCATAALDLSGHGRSGRRPDGYSIELWASEIIALLDHLGATTATIVGHSFGGVIASAAAATAPARVSALVLVDTVIHTPGPEEIDRSAWGTSRAERVYPDRDTAVAAFKLLPPQPPPRAAVMQALAERAVSKIADGWTWAFDPSAVAGVSTAMIQDQLDTYLPRVRCPVTYVYGADSQFDGRLSVAALGELVTVSVTSVVVPDAHHHVPLDAPEALAAIVRDTVAT